MKKNQLFNSLSNYIDSQDQFAVMVDGPWGSGKTFFFKHHFIPCICKKHRTVYFSVYGYESLNELKTALFNQLFVTSLGIQADKETTKSKIKDLASLTKGTIGAFDKLKPFVSLAHTAENILIKNQLLSQNKTPASVLIIDDLERISQQINIDVLMGFLLTDIIEDYGYRVILVGNSKEIQEKKFLSLREKVISRVLPFTYDLKNIKKEFLQHSNITFLQDNSDWLVEILEGYSRHNKGQLNLRTLEFILSTFKLIDKNLNQYFENNLEQNSHSKEIKRSVFANLFVIATEYRAGILTRENLKNIDPLLDTRNFSFIHMKDDEEKSPAEQLTIRYHNNTNLTKVIMYDSSVTNVIFNGNFSAQHFVDCWKGLFNSKKEISNLDRISNFREMTDDQLKNLEGQLLKDACSQEAKANDILLTLNYFKFFDKNDIYFCNDNYLDKLINALKEAVNRSFESNKLPYSYDPNTFNVQYSVLVNDTNIMNRIRDIMSSAKDKNHRLETQKLVKAIFDNDTDTIRNMTQSGIKINIFEELLESNYLNNALLEPKSKATLLDNYLNSEYLQISNSHDFHHGEQSDISKLIEKIETYTQIDNSIGQIDRFNLNNLVKTLKDILTKFKQ
ncbi:KAP family NTPase [Lactiplantibacillus plantarum]|uniref:KAP family NTPase n=1 Tax=Lactobacillaceae TaxID=33958 RepID=UPI0021F7A0DD|nr:KAP family NTPase [Lactiplantibacillus plantarum]MCW0154713.1 KAP family NTPase [Lactiplantibacillus plantarum]